MAGLVPAIPTIETRAMRRFFVYILASRPGGAIYVGVTSDLIRRVYEHKQGTVPGHTKRYQINKPYISKNTLPLTTHYSVKRT